MSEYVGKGKRREEGRARREGEGKRWRREKGNCKEERRILGDGNALLCLFFFS